jgi:hypothetical protein
MPGCRHLHGQRLHQANRNDRNAVLPALPVPDPKLPLRQIHILDAQLSTFEQPEPGPVHQRGHQPLPRPELRQQPQHLLLRQHHGKPLRTLRPNQALQPVELHAENVAVKEHERAEGLILRGRGDVTLDGK